MADSFDILRSELSELVSSNQERLDEINAMRSAQQRIDSCVSLLKEVIRESSLCYLGDKDSKFAAFFDGQRYVPVSLKRSDIPNALSTLEDILQNHGVGATDSRKIGDMPFVVMQNKIFGIDHNKVAFDNCVLDVMTGNVLDFGTSNYTDYKMPYSYHEDARCPMWKKFLNEVMPDEDEQSCLQEFFGMCYLDRNRWSVEKFAIFIGSGRNGKSVVFDVIKSVIGKDRVSNLSPHQLTDDKHLVEVNGKRLNFAPDVRKKSDFDSALKALSSGQDVAGWRLYAGSTVVKCPPLVFALNEMPRFRDVTSAFFRRVMLFSFDVVIPEEKQDRRLASKIIENESGGVFRWIMEGLWRLMENKGEFTYCQKMEANLEALQRRVRNEENPVLQYLNAIGYYTEPVWKDQPYVKVNSSTIYDGMGGRISKDAITKELKAAGVKTDRGTEVRYYLYKK